MAKKSLVVKSARPQKYETRNYLRCNRCGRPRATFRKFGVCRICLRQLAQRPGHHDAPRVDRDVDASRNFDRSLSDSTHANSPRFARELVSRRMFVLFMRLFLTICAANGYQTWQMTSPPTPRSSAALLVMSPWEVDTIAVPIPPSTRGSLSFGA